MLINTSGMQEAYKPVQGEPVKLKQPQMLVGLKRTFNTYNKKAAGAGLVLNNVTRNGWDLEQFCQQLNRKRYQAYVPKTIDLPEFSQEALGKELDIYTLTITSEKTTEGFKREIVREDNEDGKI